MIPVFMAIMIIAVLLAAFNELNTLTDRDTPQEEGQPSQTVSSTDDSEKLMTLIAPYSPLQSGYKQNLTTYRGIEVDKAILSDLKQMTAASQEDGMELLLDSGYVSAAEQNELYVAEVKRLMEEEGYSREDAEVNAEYAAPQGNHYDTQSGLSVSFSSEDSIYFEYTDEYLWLVNNSYKYGFILRYPSGKESFTGIEYNPHLFRYIGRDNALKLRKLDMCLDEYIKYTEERK